MSCDTYCKQSYAGYKCGSCNGAVDTATGQQTTCSAVRGYNVKEHTCYCSDCEAPQQSE